MSNASGFTVVSGPSVYMILAPDGTEGGLTDYGETATIRIDGAVYMCHKDVATDPDGVGMVASLVPQVTLSQYDADLEVDDGYEDDEGEEGGEGEEGEDDDEEGEEGEDDDDESGEPEEEDGQAA